MPNNEDAINNEENFSDRKKNFFVELYSKIENFNKKEFAKKREVKKDINKDIKQKQKELENSETTLGDMQKQRSGYLKKMAQKLGLVGLVVILITGAVILALQDNEQMARRPINIKSILNDTTSFGGIDKKDYFLEQNILDDKINIVEKKAEDGRKVISANMLEQTSVITEHIDTKLTELSDKQTIELENTKKSILKIVDQKVGDVISANTDTKRTITNLKKKVEGYKNAPRLKLNNGKIIFPNANSSTKVINPIPDLNTNNSNSGNELLDTNNRVADIKIIKEVEYETVEVDMGSVEIQELSFDTGMKDLNQSKIKNFEFDLTTTLVRITLINGIKAPTLDIGVKNPTPVLMSVDGIAYAANDQTSGILKGCLLRGVAVGNINTSRAEIFGTHLSCILEGDSGDLYKIEHTFPDNEVWIKGEDGADGVSGLIVDSSGKILSKSAAIGFLQGLTNYFSAQNLVTGGVVNTTQSTISQLGTSVQSGVGSGMETGFDLIIAKYEKILSGYYPFIDIKGGRKNLTAIFAGGVKIIATPYKEAHLENY
ncbi:TraB/VirB10 family protein [Sulfurimonas sp.]|uniref:TraB/VirB10 family protein n=1 Tax=Sulfurimonas sp. TaxID=2022749 RepID=UPI0025EABF19|nr:TraB/VirB10 family protein [Sulfurimonas sp.]